MSIVTKSGVEITDEMMDAIADAFDRGELPGKMTRVVMGRPRISNEPLRSIGCRAPESRVLAFEKKAKKEGETKSQRLRLLMERDVNEDQTLTAEG